MNDYDFLKQAIDLAKESVSQGGFPAGAIIVKDGEVIGKGISMGNILNDPTSHGETAAIREACKNLKTTNLTGATLYASMKPCLMCLGSAMWGNVSRIVYACAQEKVSREYYGGDYEGEGINSTLLHPIEFIHVKELEESSFALVEEWESKHSS
jgi:tRNA(Arg) A34 adenosine deaminase TadA